MEMNRKWRYALPLAAAFGVMAACSPDSALGPLDAAQIKGGVKPTICTAQGDWVFDGANWTLTGENDLGSAKIDVGGVFTAVITAPSGYVVSGYCAKAGTFTEEVNLTAEQQTSSYTVEVSNGKATSHYSLRFAKITTNIEDEGEWCSPGFWKNDFEKWDALAWPAGANVAYSTLADGLAGATKPALKDGGDATLAQVMGSPNTYGGPAANYAAIFVSLEAGMNVVLDDNGAPVHNCTLTHISAE